MIRILGGVTPPYPPQVSPLEVTNSIIMNNSIIESVPSQKCLGVELDNRLIFDIHIENLCKKICSGIGALRRIKPFVPLRSLKMLYKAQGAQALICVSVVYFSVYLF
jgi:hypothetical protein